MDKAVGADIEAAVGYPEDVSEGTVEGSHASQQIYRDGHLGPNS